MKLSDGRVMVRGTVAVRVQNTEIKGGPKRADYVLHAMPNEEPKPAYVKEVEVA